MANYPSARKRIRRDIRRTKINQARRGRVRTFVVAVEKAIQNGDAPGAREAFRRAQPELHRGVTKGLFNRKAVARKLSRLAARVKALS